MKKYFFIGVFVCLTFLVSCASMTPVRQYETDKMMFTSNTPNLKVRFKDTNVQYLGEWSRTSENTNKEYHTLKTNHGRIGIIFFEFWGDYAMIMNHYSYGPEYMAKYWFAGNTIDTVKIDGKKWVKYYYISDDDELHTGYLTRKGNYMICIVRPNDMRKNHNDVQKYRDTAKLTPWLSSVIDTEFEIADKIYEIVE